MITSISSKNAPKTLGPYSQGVQAENFIFLSGQLGINPSNDELAATIGEQTRQALKNLKNILLAANCDMSNVVRCDIFLTKMQDFTAVNKIYEEYFISDPKPARQTVEVSALPKNALVEISCIAFKQ